jgi:hypothetical protein
LPHKVDASSQPDRCTTGCTGEPDSANGDHLAALAATLAGLSTADRARLAAILTQSGRPVE